MLLIAIFGAVIPTGYNGGQASRISVPQRGSSARVSDEDKHPASGKSIASFSSPESDPSTRLRLEAAYANLPLSFEANQGQTDRRAKFLSRGPGYCLFLTPTEAVLALNRTPTRRRYTWALFCTQEQQTHGILSVGVFRCLLSNVGDRSASLRFKRATEATFVAIR